MNRAHSRGEGGYTLTEVLVAVTILTTAIVVIVGAMSAGIIGSRVHRDIVTSDSIARTYADQLTTGPYVGSAVSTTPSYQMTGVPAGFTAQITGISYWTNPGVQASAATFGTPCPSTDGGMQQITIQVQRTNGAGSQILQIVKRQP